MNSTGLKGSLDDAYTLAVKLQAELNDAFFNEATGRELAADLLSLTIAADDLSSRISNLILQLRS